MRGQGDDGCVAAGDGQGLVGADLARRGITIHLRHAAIHENEIGRLLLPKVHGLAAVDGDIDADIDLPQHLDDHLAVDGIVIGDHDMTALEAGQWALAGDMTVQHSLAAQRTGVDAGDHIGDVGLAERQDHQIIGAAFGNGSIAIRVADPAEANDARAMAGREDQVLQAAGGGEDNVGLRNAGSDDADAEARPRKVGSER